MISVFAFSKTIKYKYKQINTNINDYLTKIDLLKRWMGIGYSSTGALVASESVVLSHTL